MLLFEKRARKKGHNLIAGIDEAGRGPLAGPVVASAVILKDLNFTCEIDDSKRLTPKKRFRASTEICDKAVIGVGIVSEQIIDKINIRQATIMAMEEAVSNLNVEPDILLIDGNIKLNLPCPQKPIIRGDARSASIAAASIIAKVTRDLMMHDYHKKYPQYRFDLHKGYGTRLHIKRLKRYGISPIHRRTFKVKT